MKASTLRLVKDYTRPVAGGSVSSDVRDLILLEGAARLLPGVDRAAAELRVAVTTRDVELLLRVVRKLPSLAELYRGLAAEHERSVL